MADFPTYKLPVPPILTPWHTDSLGFELESTATTPLGSTITSAWPTANLAIFIPFTLYDWGTAYQLLWFVGATSSGNISVGIYDSQKNLIVSNGPVAMSATVNTVQELNITDTLLPPGQYLLAGACSNTTGTVFGASPGTERGFCSFPVWQQSGLTNATLTDPGVPVPYSGNPRVPAIGIQFRSVF